MPRPSVASDLRARFCSGVEEVGVDDSAWVLLSDGGACCSLDQAAYDKDGRTQVNKYHNVYETKFGREPHVSKVMACVAVTGSITPRPQQLFRAPH